MADRFWVGGTGNWTDTAHWSAASGGASGASVPTSADNAIFDANSNATAYTVTVNAAAACLDLNFSAAPASGTITLAGTSALDVYGNITMLSGMTRSYTGALTMRGVAKTIQTNGVSMHQIDVWVGGSVTQLDALTQTALLRLGNSGAASWDTGGFNITNTSIIIINLSTFTLGTSVVTTNQWFVDGGSTLSALTSTLNVPSASATPFGGGGKAYGSVTLSMINNIVGAMTGANSFVNLTLQSGSAVKGNTITLDSNITVSGTFKYIGNSVLNRLMLQSSVRGTARTITAAAIDAASDFTDFMDITGAGAASPFATGTSLGDCQGNSGITFTAPVTQTATGTAGFSWSTHGWTTRVPLPQDNVVISNAFVGGQIVTLDMPRLGKDITFSCTGNPMVRVPSNFTTTFFGSWVSAVGMTFDSATGGNNVNVSGRGTVNMTSNGVAWRFNEIMTFNGPGATINLLDDFIASPRPRLIILAIGAPGTITFNTNNHAMTIGGFAVGPVTGETVNLNLGSSLITLTFSSNQIWSVTPSGGTLNFNAGTSTIKVDASASPNTFLGGGVTYHNVWFASGLTSIAPYTNTYNEFKVTGARTTVIMPSAPVRTQTAASWVLEGSVPGISDAPCGATHDVVGAFFSTPDSAAASITGDIDIRVKAAMTTSGRMVSKRQGGDEYQFDIAVGEAGVLSFVWWEADGTIRGPLSSSVGTGIAVGAVGHFRVTLDVDNGAGGHSCVFYTSTDGVVWAQLGTAQSAGAFTTNIKNGTSPLFIGSNAGLDAVSGVFYRVQLYAGAVLAVDFDPSLHVSGSTFVAATGETWTANGNALFTESNFANITAAAPVTIVDTAGGKVKGDYLAVRNSSASPTPYTFYAGNNSTDSGGNTGWHFYDPDYVVDADPGAFAVVGVDADLMYGRIMRAAAGAFVIDGQDAPLVYARIMRPAAGAYLIEGIDTEMLSTVDQVGAGETFSFRKDAESFVVSRV